MSVEPLRPPAPEVAALVQTLRAAFNSGLTRDLAWRQGQLAALERMMAENEAAIAEALGADLGKPFGEACTATRASICVAGAGRSGPRPRSQSSPARASSRPRPMA
jgi:acyl-CoA reductase-like NAD-dependent aldehyde dehydrogenase